MFGVEIASVGGAWLPVEVELVVCLAVLEPVVAHVHTFRFLRFAGTVNDSMRCFVVDADWSGWLWMAKFF